MNGVVVIKKFLLRLSMFFGICCFLFISACTIFIVFDNDDESTVNSKISTYDTTKKSDKKTGGTWAVYWYLCGSDLESEGGAATDDIQEMLDVELPENVKVIIETGGAKQWQNEVIASDKIERYVAEGDDMQCVDTLDNANMGKAETLEDFLKFCNENYDADHKIVLFWNHGGGSIGGLAYDENYDYDSLTLTELKTAFANTSGEKEYDMIGFDTCLMASLETADAMAPFADYMVASEETEPGTGWDYTGWLSALAKDSDSISAPELGKVICDTYYESCKIIDSEDTVTLSVIDLSEIYNLKKMVESMSVEVLSNVVDDSSNISSFSREACEAENYGGNTKSTGYYNMVDLGDMTNKCGDYLKDSEALINDAISKAVVYSINGEYRSHSNGISIYFPLNGDSEEVNCYEKMGASKTYQRLLKYLVDGELPDDVQEIVEEEADESGNEIVQGISINYDNAQSISDFDGNMPLSIDEEQYVTMNIPVEQLDSIKDIKFGMYMYLDDETSDAVFLGYDNDINYNWETGEFKDDFRGVWGCLNGCITFMEIIYSGDDYNLYSIPVKINSEEYYLVVSYNYEKQEFEVLGAKKEIDSNIGMADKELLKVPEGAVVEPILSVYVEEEDDFEDITIDEITVDSNGLVYTEEELPDGNYSYCFMAEDIKGQIYLSDFAGITYENGNIYTWLQ